MTETSAGASSFATSPRCNSNGFPKVSAGYGQCPTRSPPETPSAPSFPPGTSHSGEHSDHRHSRHSLAVLARVAAQLNILPHPLARRARSCGGATPVHRNSTQTRNAEHATPSSFGCVSRFLFRPPASGWHCNDLWYERIGHFECDTSSAVRLAVQTRRTRRSLPPAVGLPVPSRRLLSRFRSACGRFASPACSRLPLYTVPVSAVRSRLAPLLPARDWLSAASGAHQARVQCGAVRLASALPHPASRQKGACTNSPTLQGCLPISAKCLCPPCTKTPLSPERSL